MKPIALFFILFSFTINLSSQSILNKPLYKLRTNLEPKKIGYAKNNYSKSLRELRYQANKRILIQNYPVEFDEIINIIEKEVNHIDRYFTKELKKDSVYTIINYFASKLDKHDINNKEFLDTLDNFKNSSLENNKINITIAYIENFIKSERVNDSLSNYSGNAKVNINTNTTQSDKQAGAAITFDLKKSGYKDNFRMKGGLNYIKNGSIATESVTDIVLDYQRHLTTNDENSSMLYGFADVSRYSNTFIGLNNRWEVNTGLRFDFFAFGNTEKGKNINTSIESMINDLSDPIKLTCISNCTKLSTTKDDILRNYLTEETKDNSLKRLKQIKAFNKTQHYKLMFGLKASITGESESYKIKGDSINIERNGKIDTSIINDLTFESSLFLRAALRPYINMRFSDHFSINAECGYIFRFLSTGDSIVLVDPNFNDEVVRLKDYRIDLKVGGKLKLTKVVSIGLNLRYLYDAAPLSQYSNVLLSDRTFLIQTEPSHLMGNFTFQFNFL